MEVIAICFGQFGPYHHARVSALQQAAAEQDVRVVPVQIAAATTTYEWEAVQGTAGPKDQEPKRPEDHATNAVASPRRAEGLRTLCEGVEEAASPLDVFLKARKLFREAKVEVAFLPSYSPARYFALLAAAKSLGIRTVMMNESHAGTEQATGWKRWIKRQIVKQFDAALVGGEPHKRHFASLGIPADKIFTGYDAVDNDFFATRADEIRAAAKKSSQSAVSVGLEQQACLEDSAGSGQVPSIREAYGLPERYFLSLGRMVEKKNLSTLLEAYARYAEGVAVAGKSLKVKGDDGEKQGDMPGGAASPPQAKDSEVVTSHQSLATRYSLPALVFVGSGELEGALREQARSLGLRVIDRMGLRIQETKRRKDEEPSLRDGARLSRGQTEGPQKETDDCELMTDDSAAQRGAVFFYGFRQIEENPVFYALAEAFVLPSLKEEWGLVVNEAMAAGLPVIVSRTAGCAEDLVLKARASLSSQLAVGSSQSGEEKKTDDCKLLTDDSLEERSNGFVFDPKSSDALSEALRRIADQKTKSLTAESSRQPEAKPRTNQETDGITEMGRRSREIVERFSCENFARQALRAAEAASA